MAYEDTIWANTRLSPQEIRDVLFKDLEFQNDEEWPGWIKGDGFDCYISHNPAASKGSLYLEREITLTVDFRYRGGYENAMIAIANWMKYTDSDTVLECNGEFIALLRICGRLIKNSHSQADSYFNYVFLRDLPYEEADLGDWLVEDKVFVDCVHDTLQIMENYCRRLFDDQETKVVKSKTAHAIPETCARVEREAFQIGTFRYRPLMWPEKWKRAGNKYSFLPNHKVDIFYTKGRGIPLKKLGAYDVPIRDVTLKGVAGLIKSEDYSLVLEFSDPKRDILIYHAGELTLFEDSCWTEERLALFEGIPYRFSAPVP